ncbi:hypothetical protein MKX01_016319, partial [Papaver californicum]
TEKLVVALGIDLFPVNDEKFMDMFEAPGAVDTLQNGFLSARNTVSNFELQNGTSPRKLTT